MGYDGLTWTAAQRRRRRRRPRWWWWFLLYSGDVATRDTRQWKSPRAHSFSLSSLYNVLCTHTHRQRRAARTNAAKNEAVCWQQRTRIYTIVQKIIAVELSCRSSFVPSFTFFFLFSFFPLSITPSRLLTTQPNTMDRVGERVRRDIPFFPPFWTNRLPHQEVAWELVRARAYLYNEHSRNIYQKYVTLNVYHTNFHIK